MTSYALLHNYLPAGRYTEFEIAPDLLVTSPQSILPYTLSSIAGQPPQIHSQRNGTRTFGRATLREGKMRKTGLQIPAALVIAAVLWVASYANISRAKEPQRSLNLV